MRCSGAGALAVRRAIWRPAAAVRGRTGAAGACATLGHAARGAVARAVAARSVRAATEGTLRRDFAKGLFEETSLDFSKGLSKRDFRRDFSQGLNIYTTAMGHWDLVSVP
jgi:hypothetical protein